MIAEQLRPLDTSIARQAWERAPARIKVVGVGGGGCNCVRRMVQHDVRGAAIFFGMSIDRSLDDDVKMTLIATGLKENVPNAFSLNPFKGMKRGSNEHPYESGQTETYTALNGNGKVIPGTTK